jgi:CIC family chloride channel protein
VGHRAAGATSRVEQAMTATSPAAGRRRESKPTAIVVAVATIIGVVVGVVVLALEHLVEEVLHHVFEHGPWLPAVVVASGVAVTAAATHWLSGGETATTEEYVRGFHTDEPDLDPKRSPGRLLAAFTSLATGAPLGMEGPAVYTGAATATVVHRWSRGVVSHRHHPLLVAGAAAGIAAVFKAPAAGAIFALEVPFRGRLAGERVLPAIFGAGAGYLTMASVEGFEPEVSLPLVELSFGRVVGSILLGVVVGLVARVVIECIRFAEESHERWPGWARAIAAAAGLAGVYAIGYAASEETIGLASGNAIFDWVLEPSHSVAAVTILLVIRTIGPAVAIMGGGVGGLFIPLMAIGALIGRLFADAANVEELTLFVLVGAACMLGAGYAAPLTGVVFIAEYTGQEALIVPALMAMAATQLVVGRRSVSPNQVE